MVPVGESHVVRSGVFEFDLRSGEVRKQGRDIRLQGQPREVLRVLVERAGETVTRDELRHVLWPGETFVDFDNGLNVAIKKIRRVLGDSASSPRFVETIPRRGYRFLAPVIPTTAEGVDVAQEPARSAPAKTSEAFSGAPLRRWFVAGIVALSILCAAVVLRTAVVSGSLSMSSPSGLAVMPFNNLLGDSDSDYMVDGLTDTLITDLATSGVARVVARQSVMRYGGRPHDITAVARELGVDSLIEGTIVRVGTGFAINVQLVDGRTRRTRWAERFDRATWDAIGVSDDIVAALARELGRTCRRTLRLV